MCACAAGILIEIPGRAVEIHTRSRPRVAQDAEKRLALARW